MKQITLGSTGITVPQNGFGALPIQRVPIRQAVAILRRAYEGGMIFFDTANAYTDSESKLGEALSIYPRESYYLASKTMGKTPEVFWEHLNKSLATLRTDYLDIYQFHCVDQVFRPGDGTGLYECMLEAKAKGKIRHIAITAHKLSVALEAVESGLYEVIQFPLSYLSSDQELELVRKSAAANMGYLAMKGMAGGLITHSKPAMAFMAQFDNVLPIWGVQREKELDEWLSYMDDTPVLDDEMRAFIESEKKELAGNFCRSCGYCMPCPVDINIRQCARMSLMLRRAPSEGWLSPQWQEEMKKVEDCLHCGQCASKCPYGLDTPTLLEKNYEDYKKVLAGEVSVK